MYEGERHHGLRVASTPLFLHTPDCDGFIDHGKTRNLEIINTDTQHLAPDPSGVSEGRPTNQRTATSATSARRSPQAYQEGQRWPTAQRLTPPSQAQLLSRQENRTQRRGDAVTQRRLPELKNSSRLKVRAHNPIPFPFRPRRRAAAPPRSSPPGNPFDAQTYRPRARRKQKAVEEPEAIVVRSLNPGRESPRISRMTRIRVDKGMGTQE